MIKRNSMDPNLTCHCFYREDDHCFLGRPGPEGACTAHRAPAKIDPAPIDPELAKKFKD